MKSKIILLFSVLTVFALLAVTVVPSVSAINGEPMYLHPVEPIDPMFPITDPVCTEWHELYPAYCNYYHLSDWNDNDDHVLSPCDQIEMGGEWYHVDEMTVTIIVGDGNYLEFEGGYEQIHNATHEPVGTLWHEVHPEFCNRYQLFYWEDNGDESLSTGDVIAVEDTETGEAWDYHVEEVTIDIIVTHINVEPPKYLHPVEPIDPMFPITQPVCTWWHELYPEYCNGYHLSSWHDNGDGVLSPCDYIDMTDEFENVAWYHVDEVTVTIFVSSMYPPEEPMYLEFEGGYEEIPIAIHEPVCTFWHEVHPEFCKRYHLHDWIDNGDGYLSYCDYIFLENLDTQELWEYHVEEVTIDIIVTPEMPDLVVGKIVTIEDGTFTVSYTVTNIGNAQAGPSKTCKFVDGVRMESQLCPALPPGGSKSGTFGPEPCPCGEILNVTVCADNDDEVVESDETNNCEVNFVLCPTGIPGIEVNKTVWNGTAWVKRIEANICDTVKFNSTIHNNGTCCDLFNITVMDTMSDSLEFVGVQGATPEPEVIENPDGSTTLKWFIPGPLAQSNSLTFLIDAHVTKCGEDWNKQNATANTTCGEPVYDEDYAYVTVLPKPDLVITDKWLCWPDNCTICYNVTNIGNGTAPACHNTTLYVDGVAVAHDHVPVNLAPNASYIGCFDDYSWMYTSPRNNITVCADNNKTVDEVNEDNNCLTNIWTCGDVNGDGKVTMSDVRKVFNRYLDPNYPLDLPWAADVNCDGKVSMTDVRKVFNRYLDPSYALNCCCEWMR